MKKILSPALLLLAAVIWGFAFSAQKAAAAIPVFALTAQRSFLAGVFLIGMIFVFDLLRKNGRRLVSRKGIDFTRDEIVGGVLCGIALTVSTAFQQAGLSVGTGAGKTSFITVLYVLIVPVYALFFGKKSPFRIWISVAIAVVGFWFLCVDSAFTVAPSDLLVLACAFLFAVHIMVIDYFTQKCDGIRLSCIQFFTVGILAVIASFLLRETWDFSAIGENLFSVLYLGIGSSGIAYTCQILGQKGTHPAVASVLMSLESVFGVVGAAIFLHETMTAREYIGCAIVFVAVILSQLEFEKYFGKKKKAGVEKPD